MKSPYFAIKIKIIFKKPLLFALKLKFFDKNKGK